MKAFLWFIYVLTKIYPLGFLIVSVKSMGWVVSFEGTEDGNVVSITIKNPTYIKDDE